MIKEIDRYIKKMNTFATWITELAATFVILLATSTTNYFFELYNAYLNLISKYELLSIIKNYSHSAHINVFLYVCIATIDFNYL